VRVGNPRDQACGWATRVTRRAGGEPIQIWGCAPGSVVYPATMAFTQHGAEAAP